jgi:hypothetical protein
MILRVDNIYHDISDDFSEQFIANNPAAVRIVDAADLDDYYTMTSALTDISTANMLNDARKTALAKIAAAHAEMLTLATGGASAAERDTWVVKEAAALDVLTGGDGSGAIVPVDGESLETLAEKIVAKAAGYRHIVGIADKIKRQAEKAVETLALETPDDLEQLDVVLATAKTLADAAIAQVMGE